MIAKIKLDDREYFSYIFFICKCDYQTKVIVYNEEENKFCLMYCNDSNFAFLLNGLFRK